MPIKIIDTGNVVTANDVDLVFWDECNGVTDALRFHY